MPEDFVQRLRMNSIYPTGGNNPFGAPDIPQGGFDINHIINAIATMRANQRNDDMIQEDSMHRRGMTEHLSEIARRNAMQYQDDMSSPLRAQGGMNVVLGAGQKPGMLNGETLAQADAHRTDPYFKPTVADNYQHPDDLANSQPSALARIAATGKAEKEVAGVKANSAAVAATVKDISNRERDATKQSNTEKNIALRDANATKMVDTKEQADEKKKLAADTLDKSNKQTAVKAMATQTLDALNDLLDPKTGRLKEEIKGAIGPSRFFKSFGGLGFMPGSESRTADRKLKNFTANTVLNLIGEMKAQSKTGATGFGALNIKELGKLEDAANKLDSYENEDDYADELQRIREKLNKILEPGDDKIDDKTPKKMTADDYIKKHGG